MPLMKGYSTTSPKRLAKARNLAGGRSWSRKKMTPCSSQVWRMAAIALWPGSAARSMPKISAPTEPDSGLTSNPFAGHRRRSSSMIVDSAFAGGKPSTGDRAMPTLQESRGVVPTAHRGDRALQDGTHWPMMAVVRSVAVGATARNAPFDCRDEFGRAGRSKMAARGRSKRTAPQGGDRGRIQCLARLPAVNSWPRRPPAPRWRRSNSRRRPIAQAAPFKLGLLTVKTGPLAQGGIQMEQGVVTWLKENNNTIAGRKVEFFSADTGGNPGRHQDQGAGTGRARQGRHHPRAARGLRAAGDHRLHRAEQDSAAEPRRRRGHDAAPAQSVFPPRLGNLRAGDASDGGLRRQGVEAQARHLHLRRLRLRSRTDGRLPADLRGERRQDPQENLAAAGHAGLHAVSSRRSPIATASARASPARIRCAS